MIESKELCWHCDAVVELEFNDAYASVYADASVGKCTNISCDHVGRKFIQMTSKIVGTQSRSYYINDTDIITADKTAVITADKTNIEIWRSYASSALIGRTSQDAAALADEMMLEELKRYGKQS